MLHALVIILGLIVFEVVSSIDNAIVNAHVLSTVPKKYRKFFLTWGLIIAVVVVRGLLPFVIVFLANTDMSIADTWHLAWSDPIRMDEALHETKPLLLVGGGMYLFLTWLAWLLLEEKRYAFFVEHFLHKQSAWFYAISSVAVTVVIYLTMTVNPGMALAASIGTSAFFLTDGFRKVAEEKEQKMEKGHTSAIAKLLYLEVLDASFSIDGVIGAFAFTSAVPLILVGNGIGALVVREFTVRGTSLIQRFAYLKNGAMYSIGMLGVIMVLESFGAELPYWLAPMNTGILLVIFLLLSYREMVMSAQKK